MYIYWLEQFFSLKTKVDIQKAVLQTITTDYSSPRLYQKKLLKNIHTLSVPEDWFTASVLDSDSNQKFSFGQFFKEYVPSYRATQNIQS